MASRFEAEKIIRTHVLWAMGGGLIPIPLVDFAAVTAIQLEMLQQLAELYQVNYSKSNGKAFVSALTGTTLASLGASMLKAIPGIGSLVGGASMSIMSGASTYAVGQVAINVFSGSGSHTHPLHPILDPWLILIFNRQKKLMKTLLKGENLMFLIWKKMKIKRLMFINLWKNWVNLKNRVFYLKMNFKLRKKNY